MSGFFRKPAAMLKAFVERHMPTRDDAVVRHRPQQSRGALQFLADLAARELQIKRWRRNDHLRRVGRSKYRPHQGAKERAKWRSRLLAGTDGHLHKAALA